MAIINYAQQAFSTDTPEPLILIPRQKFNFKLMLTTPTGTINFTRISSVTYPGVNFETTTLSQYNIKRVIQTKIIYEPMTVSFYDTFDNQAQTLFRDYIKHYYHGNKGIDEVPSGYHSDSTVAPFLSTDFGYTPTANTSDKYFFPLITIEQVGGPKGSDRRTILHNSIILSISGDTLDYSDSGSTMFTVQFQPESTTVL